MLPAQTLSEKRRFEVDYVIGCAPLTVTITDLDSANVAQNPTPILVSFNRDSSDLVTQPINEIDPGASIDTTYTEPGDYLIAQFNANPPFNSDPFDYLRIRVLPPDTFPVYDINLCANNTVSIDFEFERDPFDGYIVGFGSEQDTIYKNTDPPLISHVFAQQGNYEITIHGLLTNGYDGSCNDISESITTIDALPGPSINALSVIDNSTIDIGYDSLHDHINYRLEADDGNGFISITTIDPAANRTLFTLSDSFFNFSDRFYLFRIIAFENCGNAEAGSNEVPSIVLNYSAVYVDNQIDITLNWETSGANLSALSVIADGLEVQTPNTATDSAIFTIGACTEETIYEIEANYAGTTSRSIALIPDLTTNLTPPTPEAPVVQLVGGQLVLDLTSPLPDGSFFIMGRDTDSTFTQIGNAASNQFTDQNPTIFDNLICYRIGYIDVCGNRSELSEEICVDVSSDNVLAPTAFFPNSSNRENKEFRITDGIYSSFQLLIYNRLGILVFTSNDSQQGWDGYHDGNLAPFGTYVYRLTYQKDGENTPRTRTGSFLLIR